MAIYWAVVFTILGMVFGSFFNVLSDRLPARKSIIAPPSHCPQCGIKLKIFDLIPVFSYIFLHGRCRYCGASIPKRVFLVELTTGAIFLVLYLFFGLSTELGIGLFYFSVLLLILITDLEHQLILNIIIYPVAIIVLVINALTPSLSFTPAFFNGLLGGGVGLVLFLLIFLVSRGGIGLGDVKMAGLMGLMLGLPGVLVGIFIGIVVGGIVASVALLTKRKKGRQAIPFGPFLSLGTMAALLWGQNILDWYLGFFSF